MYRKELARKFKSNRAQMESKYKELLGKTLYWGELSDDWLFNLDESIKEINASIDAAMSTLDLGLDE